MADNKPREVPAYYRDAADPYEPWKIVENWQLNYHLSNTVVYILRAGKKPGEPYLKELKKARAHLDREISLEEVRIAFSEQNRKIDAMSMEEGRRHPDYIGDHRTGPYPNRATDAQAKTDR